MIRPVLRAYIPIAAILCLFIGVLCLPDGSAQTLAERAPAWLLWTGGILAGSPIASSRARDSQLIADPAMIVLLGYLRASLSESEVPGH